MSNPTNRKDPMTRPTPHPHLYLVTVEQVRESSFWVHAPTWNQARADADGLAPEIDCWDSSDTTVTLELATEAPAQGDEVWAGGESGGWVQWRDLQPRPLQTESLF